MAWALVIFFASTSWGSGEHTGGGGVPEEIPVDLWVPGCPPHPLTILDGVLRLLGTIENGVP